MMTRENTSLVFVCFLSQEIVFLNHLPQNFFERFIFMINFYHNLSSKDHFPDFSLNLQKETCFKNLGDIIFKGEVLEFYNF